MFVESVASEIRQILGHNLSSARKRRGLTLVGLSEASGVGKATLSGIERGDGNPTIETIWRLATSLSVSFGSLIEGDRGHTISQEGIAVTLIDRQTSPRVVESYIMDLSEGATRNAQAHNEFVEEHVTVLSGSVVVGPQEAPLCLPAGESRRFRADTPHFYRAGQNPARLLVTIVYPLVHDDAATPFDLHFKWPERRDDWEGIRRAVERACIEVQNGVEFYRIIFGECPLSRPEARARLDSELLANRKSEQPLRFFILDNASPSLVVFARPLRFARLRDPAPRQQPIAAEAWRLADMARRPQMIDPEEFERLRIVARSSSLLNAALAAEALTAFGLPTVPTGIAHKPQTTIGGSERGDDIVLFEDRIDVDAYEAYELVHPAYARQSLLAARALPTGKSFQPLNVIDAGSGPGLPLQMLLEARSDLTITAVDPSETAFRHLTQRFAGNARVTPVMAGIDSYDPENMPFDAALSIGASHHLDTSSFFRGVRRCLRPGATFVLSDETISPFASASERRSNLIAHHLQYIVDTLISVPDENLDRADGILADRMRQEAPACLLFARTGFGDMATSRLRGFLQEIASLNLPEPTSHPLMAFYRFHVLELQALVAGLDYEVEQKTHARRLLELADHAGFECVDHQRIFATHGESEWDGGTHFFVLRRL